MKLVIDISEKQLTRIDYVDSLSLKNIIKNGEPLDEILETAERQGYYAGYSEAMREENE